MEKSKRILLNTLLLTASAFIMRGIGMVFQVYISNAIGAAGIGLSELTGSVTVLAAAFAISGARFAAMRLVSEELGKNACGNISAVMRRCLLYAAFFGVFSCAALFFSAPFIGTQWIGDARTVLPMRVIALSLPFLSMSAVLSGYFTAVCRVVRSAAAQLLEQLARIFVIMWLLGTIPSPSEDLESVCVCLSVGGVVGDMVSFFIQFTLYLFDRRRYGISGRKPCTHGIFRRLLAIALPLAVSSYARTALITVQNLLIPRGLRRAGRSAEASLSDYGMIQGMVFPVITFPSAFFYALADMLVPRLTEAQVADRNDVIASTVSRTLRLCFLFSAIFSAMLFCFSRELGYAIYRDTSVGGYIRILSLLMPVMYLDSVTDGMLRGLGQQVYSMRINILDSALCVILIYILLPLWAVKGYIFILFFSECFNFSLSFLRLHRIASVPVRLSVIGKVLFSAVGAVNAAVFLLRAAGLALKAAPGSILLHVFLSLVLFPLLALIFRCVDESDLKWFKMLFK